MKENSGSAFCGVYQASMQKFTLAGKSPHTAVLVSYHDPEHIHGLLHDESSRGLYRFHKLQSLDDSICMKRQLVIGLVGLELQDGGFST